MGTKRALEEGHPRERDVSKSNDPSFLLVPGVSVEEQGIWGAWNV